MFRTDRDALAQEVEELRRDRAQLEAQNDAMRSDLLARRDVPPPARGTNSAYKQGALDLSPGEQVALRRHHIEAFPVWAALLLHFVTFGLFSLVHFSGFHGRLPKAEHDDPSVGKAIGFSFIPYFNFYWFFFNPLRLADRLNLQFRLRGLPDAIPRGLMIAAGVFTAIPYINMTLGLFLVWPIAVIYFQRAANALAALPPDGAEVARAGAEAWMAEPAAAHPHLRVPLVRDLPGPADVIDQDAEIEADEALRRRGDVR